MSDLLNSASLVMIPSGYKEDTVYSVVPSDGSGDLQFTRSSNGTRVNSAGLVEVVAWNLLQYSEDFGNAWWENYALTITTNTTTAPNGTTTADTFTSTGNFGGVMYKLNQQSAGTFTTSVYVKAGNFDLVRVGVTDNGTSVDRYCFLNLSTLVVTNFGGASGTIESVGNGWYRFIVSFTSTGNFNIFYGLQPEGTSGKYAYFWGAQLNIGSTAKPYFPTTDRLNVPRLTYQNGGGGCPSLLLEKQSTNLLSYSQDFTQSSWQKLGQGIADTAVITANYAISPDGTQNATRFVCNLNGSNSSADRSWMITTFTAQATSTISIWIKLNTSGTKTIIFSDSGGTTKTISGTDWQRIDGTFSGASGEYRIGLIGGTGTSDTLDCCIWGGQAEASSYPTSYIPSTSSSATRVADECKKSGIGALIGGTSGTVFFDIKTNPTLSSSNYKQFCYYVTSGGSQSYLYLDGANKITTNATWGSLFYNTALQPNTRYKVALVFAPNDFALYINGVSVATASSGTPNNNVDLQIGQFNETEMCEFVFNQYTHFPSRLTNAELASLTTL